MPRFLEQRLRKEYAAKGKRGEELNHAIYGTMNSIGAMHGNKITPKGEEMEKKHMAKEAKAPYHMTHITHHDDGSHTVEHEHHRTPSSKSGAFIERPENDSYSVGTGKELISKLHEHLGISSAKAAGSQKEEREPAEHDKGLGEGEEIEEG